MANGRFNKTEKIWALVALGLAAVGSLGPWATFGVFDKAGTDGDGVISLIAAAAGVLAVLLGRGRIALLIVGLVILGIGVFDVIDVSSTDIGVLGTEVSPSVGWGLWLVAVSGAAIVLCAAARRLNIVKAESPAPVPQTETL